jgi:hypothetical protein
LTGNLLGNAKEEVDKLLKLEQSRWRAGNWVEEFYLENKNMTPFVAEIIGTMLLILLGNGVVANVVLKKKNKRQQLDCYYRWMGICRFRSCYRCGTN